MEFVSKKFNELTTVEVYEILKSRAEIFVKEQKIIYLDMDDIDYDSYHMFYMDEKRVVAYLRAFYMDEKKDVIKFGRVLTLVHGKGLGGKILNDSIKYVKDNHIANKIYLEAQSYATGYYEKAGFKIISDEFMEEGIPHKKMELLLYT